MTVPDCRIVVLGGSSGIGLAVAELLVAEEGVDLHVTGPTAEDAERVRSLLGAAAAAHTIDLLADDEDALRHLVATADVLVLSAGVEYVGPAELEPPDALAQMLAINVQGPARAAALCVPEMAARGGGLIIALGSITAQSPRPFLAGYSASKAALEAYLTALAGEVRHAGIDIRHLALGPVATELGANGPPNWEPDATSGYHEAFSDARDAAERERVALGRTPDDVAAEVVGLVHAFRSRWRRRPA